MSSHSKDLHEFGYASKQLRICDNCFSHSFHHSLSSVDSLPFRAIAIIASFLPLNSVFSLSQVNKHLHRVLFSKDFDLTFWRFRTMRAQNQVIFLKDLIDENEKIAKQCALRFASENETPTLQLSVRFSESKGGLETSSMSSTDGCHWRLEYIRIVAFSESLHCALYFVTYPIVCL